MRLSLRPVRDELGVGRDLAGGRGDLHRRLLEVVHDTAQVTHHLVEAARQVPISSLDSIVTRSVRSPLATAEATSTMYCIGRNQRPSR
jgi:hypothetical protein